MNVLITGGYGFIGSAVAERFYKEGHKIYIIDNMINGRKEHVTIPHKSYHMNVEDPACDQIFQSVGFDIVVHLAAQIDVVTSINEPAADTRTNILGLVNILNCSSKNGVKKLIFASSAAVYGNAGTLPLSEDGPCEAQSVYGMNKRLGELYCEKWGQLYGLNTLCFRFSNVYGPRQGTGGEGGVVSTFLQGALGGKTLAVFGDGSQTRDFIYVYDVADAVYRGANSDATGVMNLSTCKETSINELVGTIRTFTIVKSPVYRESRSGDIGRSCLDNALVKHELDWVPLYTIQDGLRLTYEWMRAEQSEPVTAKKLPLNERGDFASFAAM